MKRRDFLTKHCCYLCSNINQSVNGIRNQKPTLPSGLDLSDAGARGTSVITSMSNHTNINIIAMADLFRDKLDIAKKNLDEQNIKKGFPAIAKAYTYTWIKSIYAAA